jgi:hypothetical protein
MRLLKVDLTGGFSLTEDPLVAPVAALKAQPLWENALEANHRMAECGTTRQTLIIISLRKNYCLLSPLLPYHPKGIILELYINLKSHPS